MNWNTVLSGQMIQFLPGNQASDALRLPLPEPSVSACRRLSVIQTM